MEDKSVRRLFKSNGSSIISAVQLKQIEIYLKLKIPFNTYPLVHLSRSLHFLHPLVFLLHDVFPLLLDLLLKTVQVYKMLLLEYRQILWYDHLLLMNHIQDALLQSSGQSHHLQ